jgi:anaerobic sulfite reductase subunit A
MPGLKGDKDLQTAFEELSTYLQSINENRIEEARLELAVDYAKLFLGVGGKVPHPSESVYTCEDRYMMQYPSDEVLQMYWNAGADKVKEYPEPADHIAVELQFMAYLCRKIAEALESDETNGVLTNLKMQKDFVNNHLVTWIPKLTQDILASSKIDFYRGIARITNRFIFLETKTIENLLTELVRLS